MKKLFILPFLLMVLGVSAQNESEGYKFTVVKENAITSIKNQGSSGTCWSFSGVAFLESELIRTGKGEHDLSDMYIVRRNYADKASKYVRTGGNINFAQGGAFCDVLETLDEYGVVPEEYYKGLNYGQTGHKHDEIAAALTGYAKGVNGSKNPTPVWLQGFNGVLDTYFGAVPQDFTYQGKSYTPQSLAQSLGLKASDYVSLTSYTHHPFYTSFAVEVSDNWRWAQSYNLPIDELMQVFDNAVNTGSSVAWASDVSEVGFTRTGLAVMPDMDAAQGIGSDQAHWLGLSLAERNARIKNKIDRAPMPQKEITQEMRQTAFDNRETTDDHGMQIYGIAKDQKGTKYYMVKNSWGETGAYKGIWYASEAFVKYKTMSIMVHKSALPKDIAKKLGVK